MINNVLPNEEALFHQTIRFNWVPASYIDASWLSQWLMPDQLAAISRNPEASRTLNRFILNELEPLVVVPIDTFSNPMLQLLLQPLSTINHLIFFAGIAVNYQSIKQIICGQQLRQLKQQIGEDGYRFALQQAPFMAGSLCKSLSVKLGQIQDAKNSAMATGMVLLAIATSELPEPARRRLQYFFATEQAAQLYPYWKNRSVDENGHQFTKNLVLKIQELFFKIAQESIDQWKPLSM